MAVARRMVDAIDRFAASVGVSVDHANPVSEGITQRWEALRAAGVDDPGLRFACWVDLASVGGVVPPLLANCTDVGELLDTLVRFHPLWGDDEIALERTELRDARVRLRGPGGTAAHRDTRDAFFTLLARMVGQVTHPPVQPMREWHRAGGLDIVVFTAAQLSVRISAADPSLARMLIGYAEAQLDNHGGGWIDQVRQHIRSDLAVSAGLGSVAGRLAYSPRTLQQRLSDRGTTYSTLVDEERRVRAMILLANPALSVTRISVEVGFASVEGFSRAVRRWTGMSPTEWRVAQQHPTATPGQPVE